MSHIHVFYVEHPEEREKRGEIWLNYKILFLKILVKLLNLIMLEIYLLELDLCCLFMVFMRPITSLFFSLLIINFYDKENIIALLGLFSKLGKKKL